ncbi:hypothetical protein GCM10027049_12840 [Mucilaginibacter puniceus]
MKAEDFRNNNKMQGDTISDRAFKNQNEKQKQRGISNAGGQRSDQTSSSKSVHLPQKKQS